MPTVATHSPLSATRLNEHATPIPKDVLDAVALVHGTRSVDMYDRETVMLMAANLGYGEAAEWLVDHRHLYFRALHKVASSFESRTAP